MLAAAQRLRRRGDFAAVIRGGRRAGRGTVVVHFGAAAAPVTVEPVRVGSVELPARAGFVVSKAVGGAVTRNKVKRRLRELMRERLAELPAGTDVVVRAQPGAALAGYPRLRDDLDAALAAARRPHRRGRGSDGRHE